MTQTRASTRRSEPATDRTAIRPFRASLQETDLVDHRRGIQATRRISAWVVPSRVRRLPELTKSMRIIGCFLCLLFCSVNAFGQSLLWDIVEDFSGGTDLARAITLSTRSAVFIGNADNSAADVHDFVIQSLRRKTGSVRWTDRVQEFPGLVTSLQIASFQGRVFASGYTSGPNNGTDIVVRGYDALQGTLLWNSVWDTGRDDLPQAIVAGPTAVVVVGYGGNTPGRALNFIVRAYDPKSGAVLWKIALRGPTSMRSHGQLRSLEIACSWREIR